MNKNTQQKKRRRDARDGYLFFLFLIITQLYSPHHPSEMATSCRESFSYECKTNPAVPPNKIRRGNKEELGNSTCNYRGLSQTEFLPLDYGAIRAVPDPLWFLKPRKSFPAQDLSDDIVGICFFSGFVDSIETIRLSRVSKRFRSIASKQVKHLDLRRCTKLDKKKIQNIVSRFQNLSVSEKDLSDFKW